MNRRLRVSVLPLCLLLALTPAGLAQVASVAEQSATLPDASEIVARYVEAVGGRESWLAHESRTLKFLFKGPRAQLDITYYISLPNKLLRTVERPDGTVVSSNGFNGELGWVGVDRDLGARILNRRELALLVEQVKPYFDPFDPTDFESMETIELAEFNGQDCYQVKLVSKLGLESFTYFDRETGLLVGIEGESIFGNYLLESTTLISDYAEFGGLLLPRKFVFKWPGGLEQTMTIQSVDFDKVPDSLFKLPAELEKTSWPQADETVELLQLRPGHVVADIGAGVGVWSVELARRVGPDLCHHGHLRPAQAGGHSLVCPFASKAEVKTLAKDGLARTRKVVRKGGEIHIGTTDDCNARSVSHHLFPSLSRVTTNSDRLPMCCSS